MSKVRCACVLGTLAVVAIVPGHTLAGGQSGQGAAQGPRVLFPGDCRKPTFKPRQIIVACADANFVIRQISWSSWTTRRATGNGTASINNCTPSCVEGTFESFPVRVTLFDPRRCRPGRPRQFVRIALYFPAATPAGYHRRERQTFGCGFATRRQGA